MAKHAAIKAFAEAFLRRETDKCVELMKAIPSGEPDRAHCEAIIMTAETLGSRNQDDVQKALAKLQVVQSSPPSDPAIFRVELMIAARFFITVMRRFDEGRRYIRSLEQITESEPSPLVQANLLLCQGELAYALNEMRTSYELIARACKLNVPTDSNLWCVLRLGLVQAALASDEWREAEQTLIELEARPPRLPESRDELALRRTRLLVLQGKCREGLAFLDGLPPAATEHGRQRRDVYRVRLLLAGNRLREAEDAVEAATSFPVAMREHLRAKVCLFHGDYQGVREHVRKAMDVGSGTPIAMADRVLELIRAELATGRPQAAKTLLQALGPDEVSRADMLWAQVHFLEGRTDLAARRFRSILDRKDACLLREAVRESRGLNGGQIAALWTLAEDLDPGIGPPPAAAPATVPRAAAPEAALVGESGAIREVRARIEQYASLAETVLITGETGTGKDVVARLLHGKSPRAERPFIAVNCAAISDTLIESELFGHVRGAFTGAERAHEGIFEAAGDGTVFLDEISSMSPRLQAALLRVLENSEIRPVGSSRPRRVSARVIAASNQPLEELARHGNFRSDLYYRLARLSISVPPLREHPEDVPALVRHFLSGIHGSDEVAASEELLAELKARPWPGNVRELRNEVERLVLLSGGQQVLRVGAPGLEPPTPAATSPASVPAAAASGRRPRFNPLRTLREFFIKERDLTRAEVVRLLGCAPNSATRYLKLLQEEGLIERVHTSGSLRTSYFVLKGQAGGAAGE